MRTFLRRGLAFSLLLVLAVSFSACGIFGSDGGGPDWTGNWKAASTQVGFAVSLSKDQITTLNDFDCEPRTLEVTDIQTNEDGPDEISVREGTLRNEILVQVTERDGETVLEYTDASSGSTSVYVNADDDKTLAEIVTDCS